MGGNPAVQSQATEIPGVGRAGEGRVDLTEFAEELGTSIGDAMTESETSASQEVAIDWMLERLEELRFEAGELVRSAERMSEEDVAEPPFAGVSVLEGIVDTIRRAEEVWRA